MFFILESQHCLQVPHSLFCFGAGHVAPAVTTVDVLSQLAGAAWSTIGAENLITKLSGRSGRKCFTHASRVGIQCLIEGVNLQTANIFVR